MARCLGGGGRLFYAAAGSSGLMAAADALELGGTFGISPDKVRILMAGGLPTSAAMPGETEDDTVGLKAGLADAGPGDVAILVAASGTTPFTLAAAEMARAHGVETIGLANNPGGRLLDIVDVPILLQTPPEVISGSTLLGAATAQKIALNTMSSVMGVELGHVYDGMMVNLVADNEKLRQRAAGMVQRLTDVAEDAAEAALATARGNVKLAALLAAGEETLEAAQAKLDENNANLRRAIECPRKT